MPSKPPNLRRGKGSKVSTKKPSNWNRRQSRQARGYGREHDLMREQILREEPLCRECSKAGRVTPTTIADHIVPKTEDGTDDRSNYQGLCDPCHVIKTARESARARARNAR